MLNMDTSAKAAKKTVTSFTWPMDYGGASNGLI